MNDEKELFQKDWYKILGLEVGASVIEINRAARKLSIKYHPDKTTDVEATDKFLLIQKAKDILSDEGKKKVIDERALSQKKRQEYEAQRDQEMDSRRKRFRDDLEKRVAEATASTKKSSQQPPTNDRKETFGQPSMKKSKLFQETKIKSEEFIARSQEEFLKSELEKQKNLQFYRDFLAKNQKSTSKGEHVRRGREIKVKWRKSIDNITEESLLALFGTYGIIESIDFSRSKSHSHSAQIKFSTADAAQKAFDSYANSSDYRITILEDSSSNRDGESGNSEERVDNEEILGESTSDTEGFLPLLPRRKIIGEDGIEREETYLEREERVFQLLFEIQEKLQERLQVSENSINSHNPSHPIETQS